MSRVAKASVAQPSNVEITLADNLITIKGPKGSLQQKINKSVKIKTNKESSAIDFSPASSDPKAWAQAGTARAIINNMIHGVTQGFTVTLELVGVGYRAQAKSDSITLSLGFSHPVERALPEGVAVETPNNTTILVKGIDKQVVGQFASEIRALRPPEPYKGKGVRYANEQIVRKEAKKK